MRVELKVKGSSRNQTHAGPEEGARQTAARSREHSQLRRQSDSDAGIRPTHQTMGQFAGPSVRPLRVFLFRAELKKSPSEENCRGLALSAAGQLPPHIIKWQSYLQGTVPLKCGTTRVTPLREIH